MTKKYPHLLEPLKIGGAVLKNRTAFPFAPLHFLQGPEPYPADGYIAFHVGLARAGAAYINVGEWSNPNQRKIGMEDSRRMPMFDLDDPSTHNYFSQLADEVHFYGSKLCIGARMAFPEGYSLAGGPGMAAPGHRSGPTKALPIEMMDEVIDTFVDRVAVYREMGYDMCSLGLDINNRFNTRLDEYGGSTLENGLRFNLRTCRRIKERLGRDFLIESTIYGERDGQYTIDDVVEAARLAEGFVDIITLREKDLALSHPTGYTFDEGQHPTVGYAERIKKSGAGIAVAINGGYQDLDEIEGYLAAGKCDIISIGRGFYADSELIAKAKENRPEDVIPCIWCNKCHGMMGGPWLDFCSVNPELGIAHKLSRMVSPATAAKKVAVVGGGPSGMRSAIYAAQRGHEVTLYEKTGALGGQLFHAEHVRFKWPLKKFKNYMITQLDKRGVRVLLNTEASPDALRRDGFDAVIAATGAVPSIPDIRGVRTAEGVLNKGLYTCLDVYGHEDQLGKSVIIVGGSETGVETGVHLAQKGLEVTVLTRRKELAGDSAKQPHGITMSWIKQNKNSSHALDFIIHPEWEKYPKFCGITEAVTTFADAASGTVRFIKDGTEHTVLCDSIVISGGMTPLLDEALGFSDTAADFYMVGDCVKPSNLQVGMRQAYAVACQI